LQVDLSDEQIRVNIIKWTNKIKQSDCELSFPTNVTILPWPIDSH